MIPIFSKMLRPLIPTLIATCLVSSAIAKPDSLAPPSITIVPPTINANAYLLIDADSDTVLAGHDFDEQIPPASLTKMMTMYVIDQELSHGRLNLDDNVYVSKKAWQVEGSRMFLEVGSKVSVIEIIKGIIVSSANDGSIAIAEHIAGSEASFAELMNAYAKRLGMKNSNFKNVTGLPNEEHYTTARDLAILSKALIKEFPESYKLYSQRSYKYNNINQFNRNRLLWKNKYVDGIKTGHTSRAGYCFVASAKRDDMRLIAVVLGTKNDNARTEETNKLINWGFRFFDTHKIYSANEFIKDVRVWYGKEDDLKVGLKEDLYITIPQGKYNKLNAAIQTDSTLEAPIKVGDNVGTFTIHIDNEKVAERKLQALTSIEKAGFFSRMKDKLAMSFNSLKGKIN